MKDFITLTLIGNLLLAACEEDLQILPEEQSITREMDIPPAPPFECEFDIESEPFRVAEIMPQFPGGIPHLLQFINTNLQYPIMLKEACIEGKVVIQFVVKENGILEQFKIVRSIHPLLDAEAIRVVKLMPKWTPGMQRGKLVSVWVTLPVKFSLK